MEERGSSRKAFTKSQWQELELQALIFNHMALGVPVPSHLVLPFSLHPSMICERQAVAEEDHEPWRCKRTDGKKWRCSREAFGDSKYCERHKHRGKKCVTRTAEMMPLFTATSSPVSSSSSSSSPCAPPHLALDSSSRVHLETPPRHCFVFGADLGLQKPGNGPSEKREAQSPKLRLGIFGGFPDTEEERSATQLSISIPR